MSFRSSQRLTRPARVLLSAVLGGAIAGGAVVVAVAPTPAAAATCADTVTLTVPPGIRSGSKATPSVTASLSSNGLPDPSTSITFTTGSANDITFDNGTSTETVSGPGTPPNSPGDRVVTLKAGTGTGTQTVNASMNGVVCASATLSEFGPAVGQTVKVTPNQLATGQTPASTATIVTTVVDAGGNHVTDATIGYTTNGSGDTFGMGKGSDSVTASQDGTYTDSYTLAFGAPPRQATIFSAATFPAGVTDSVPSATAVVAEYGPPAAVSTPTLSPPAVPADGLVPVTVSARVTDAATTPNPVPGNQVTFSSSPSAPMSPNPATTDSNGVATTKLTPPAAPGQVAVTGTASAGKGPKSPVATLLVTPAPATVSLSVKPAVLPPDGTSTTTATATVLDAAGHAVTDAVVTITRSGFPTTSYPTVNNGDGTYSAVLHTATTPQTETITATSENKKAGSATLNETSRPGIGLQLTPSRLPADGTSTAALSILFLTPSGAPQAGQTVTLTASPGATVSPASVVTGGDGSGSAHIVAGTSPGTVVITAASGQAQSTITLTLVPPTGSAYTLVASDGGIFPFGSAKFYGSTGAMHLNKPVVGMAATPNGGGYWLVASDGGIFPFGDAKFFGSTGAMHLNKPVVGMAATPDGGGYWLVASDGGIFPFGDAKFFGSTGAIRLNQPVVGMAATPDGGGYWLVASDGGIFRFGDAVFYGSAGAIRLNKPVVGMASTVSGGGYWLVASDGGIFRFGDALFYGSTGNLVLNKPVVDMAATADGGGYWLVASDGGVFPFGDAKFHGSTGNIKLNQPIVGAAGA